MERPLQSRPLRLLRWLAAPILVFVALLVLLPLLNGSSDPGSASPAPQPAVDAAGVDADTETRIESLRAVLAEDPTNAESAAALGDAYYQLARATGDTAFYSDADEAYSRSLAVDPEQFTAVTGQATLALARHDFAGGLALAKRARSLEPDLLLPFPALIDAQVELGRYEQAAQSLDRLVSLKPTLAAYARVSYFRELNGDTAGALQAMRLAVSAGSGSAGNQASVQNLLGKLQFDLGRYGAAERSFRTALTADPADAAALAGLASLEAGRGDYRAAIDGLRTVVESSPVPEYAIALAETEEAAGWEAAAERDYAVALDRIGLLQENGENADVDLALFNADHGSATRAAALARRGWEAAPSVRSADALAWALSAAGNDAAASRWSAEAMKLGSRDPMFLYHAGMIAHADGRTDDATRFLGLLVEQSPMFHPLYGPRALGALEELR